MIDHCSLSVCSMPRSLAFYEKSLECLGYTKQKYFEHEGFALAAFGESPDKLTFWLGGNTQEKQKGCCGSCKTPASAQDKINPIAGWDRGVSIVFQGKSTSHIEAWYQVCLNAGGKGEDAPRAHPEYHSGYYGAVVIDPDGWRIEACIHTYKEALAS